VRPSRLCMTALLLTMAACSWSSERNLLRGADREPDWKKLPAERQGALLEAEFGPAPQVLRDGVGDRAHPGGLYTFRVEALGRDGSVTQEERVTLLWPEVPVDAPAGAGLSANARGPGWQLLQSCGRLGLPHVYLDSLRVGEVRLFPRGGPVRLQSMNETGSRDIRQLSRHPVGGPVVTENPGVRVTLEAFCIPKAVRVTKKGYAIPGGSYTYEYTAIKPCP